MSETGETAPAPPVKGALAFRTIGEVADDLDLPAHVLRFWELRFSQLKPLKRGGGRRYYRPEDILLLRRIRQCLYQDGYTIRGVQRLLAVAGGDRPAGTDPAASPSLFPLELAGPAAASDEPRNVPPAPSPPARRPRRRPPAPDTKAALEEIRRELLEVRALLDELLRRPKPP